MKKSEFRGEFDDYEYPYLNKIIPPEDLPDLMKAKEKAKEEAIKFAEELEKKYSK